MKNTKKYGVYAETLENIQICAARLAELDRVNLYELTAEDYRQQIAFVQTLAQFAERLKEQTTNARKHYADTYALAVSEQEKQRLFAACREMGLYYNEYHNKVNDETIKAAHDLGIYDQSELLAYLLEGIEPDHTTRYLK